MDADRCVSCGEIIPEGQQTCFMCFNALPEDDLPKMTPGTCFRCGRSKPYVTMSKHEPLMGNKYKRISEKYGLSVPLCLPDCHDYVQREPSQDYNRYLQMLMQQKFERENRHLSFLEIFGRNYL